MSANITNEELRAKFNRLSRFKTARGIAQFLRRQGIKGNHSAGSCPIAVYLNHGVAVCRSWVRTKDGNVYTTPAMAEFVSLFDSDSDGFTDLYDGN